MQLRGEKRKNVKDRLGDMNRSKSSDTVKLKSEAILKRS